MAVVPAEGVDVRLLRPPARSGLTKTERQLWDKLTFSRRPGWFSGAETLLESLVTMTIQCQEIEAALRQTPVTGADYQKLMRMHRQAVALGGHAGHAVTVDAPCKD